MVCGGARTAVAIYVSLELPVWPRRGPRSARGLCGSIDTVLRRTSGIVYLVTVLVLFSCRQEETNGPCGGLVKPLCGGSMECISVANPESKQVCVMPCRATTLDCPPPGCCPTGSSCRPVDLAGKRVSTGELPIKVGHFCIPDSPM